jgi:addiction module RelB/DinJ family antitoxin
MKNYLKQNAEAIQNVNFKIDSVVKSSAEATLSCMGLNMSAYIGMCLRQLAQDRKIPFTQTVDPDFWVIEAQVSEAKSYIDSGAFAAVAELLDESKKTARDIFFENSCTFLGEGDWGGLPPETYTILYQLSELIGYIPIERDIDKLYLILDKISSLSTPYEKKCESQLFTTYKNSATKSIDYLTQKIEELFNKNECIKELLNTDVENIDIADKRKILDDIYSTVINVAKCYKSNLSMRFAGASKQKIVETVFSAVEHDEELKKELEQISTQDLLEKMKSDFENMEQVKQTLGQPLQEELAQLRKAHDESKKNLEELEKASYELEKASYELEKALGELKTVSDE